jgi:hypothetical protein
MLPSSRPLGLTVRRKIFYHSKLIFYEQQLSAKERVRGRGGAFFVPPFFHFFNMCAMPYSTLALQCFDCVAFFFVLPCSALLPLALLPYCAALLPPCCLLVKSLIPPCCFLVASLLPPWCQNLLTPCRFATLYYASLDRHLLSCLYLYSCTALPLVLYLTLVFAWAWLATCLVGRCTWR